MASAFSLSRGGGPIRRLLLFLIGCGVIYLILVNSLVPISKYSTDVVGDASPTGESKKTEKTADAQMTGDSILSKTKLTSFDGPNTLMVSGNYSDLINGSMQSEALLPGPIATMDELKEKTKTDEAAYAESMKEKPKCPEIADIKDMRGHLPQATLLIEDMDEEEVLMNNDFVQPGGRWRPTDCVARHKVAIIIPYRDRHSHLTRLLNFLYPILRQQRIDFRFIVTEQYGDDLFNKGRIMNAAFRLAENLNVDCVIFHDVDMFPQDDRNPYGCPTTPRHLGAFVSNLGYQLWYKEIVGGALAINMGDYRSVNGYSNMYWAWGGEDDDMGTRILSQNYTIERPNPETGRYSMLKHVKRKRTAPKLIYKLLDSASTRWEVDGLNQTGLWSVVRIYERPLYYHLFVDVGTPPNEWRAQK
uniref:Beta-1,4-N-acetylgalactosaminyltransferase n=1 Tax=Steinernema glaseri TaxID=37863 RepID=A0A1I8AB40_9BILA